MSINNITSIKNLPVELLLIAPLLALSNSVIIGLSTGLVFLVLLSLIAVSVSALRRFTAWHVRIPMLLLAAATWISLLDIALTAWFYDLRQQLGIYLPLLAINSLVFAVSEEHYLRLPVRESLFHALRIGGLVLSLFLATGIIRELLAYGSLFQDAPVIFNGSGMQHLVHHDTAAGLKLVGKAPGAFICLGLVFALWNYLTGARRPETSLNNQGYAAGIE